MEDMEIVELFFDRNEEAIKKTSEKYGAYCKAVAENILKNPEDSEECVNTALLRLWNSVPPEKPENLKIFLAKITRNVAINNLKAKFAEKRGGREGFAAFDELSECIPSKNNVEEIFDEKELEKAINEFVKNLPEKERNIFIRRYFFFESTKKIGERFSFSSNRVSVILHRTRRKLLEHLKKEGLYNE